LTNRFDFPSELKKASTFKFVKMNDGHIISVLSNLGHLVFEVEVGQLRDVACPEVVDGLGEATH
jgi:hypothetical protein